MADFRTSAGNTQMSLEDLVVPESKDLKLLKEKIVMFGIQL